MVKLNEYVNNRLNGIIEPAQATVKKQFTFIPHFICRSQHDAQE